MTLILMIVIPKHCFYFVFQGPLTENVPLTHLGDIPANRKAVQLKVKSHFGEWAKKKQINNKLYMCKIALNF